MSLQEFGTSPKGSVFDLTMEPKECEIPKGKKQVIKIKLVMHSSLAEVREVVGVDIGWRENSKEAKNKEKNALRFPRRLCIYISAVCVHATHQQEMMFCDVQPPELVWK